MDGRTYFIQHIYGYITSDREKDDLDSEAFRLATIRDILYVQSYIQDITCLAETKHTD